MDPTSTRERLLAAATQVFLRQGFAATSMDMVRQEAGVSNGSLYHHFPTKARLADALYAHTLRDFHAALLVPVAGRASAQTGVKGMIRVHIDWVLQNPDRARLLQELKRAGDLAAGTGEWAQANEAGFGALREWVEAKVAAGEMRPLPFPVWMAVVFAPALSLTSFWVTQPAVPPKVRAALEHAAWMAVAP
ncbi:TetR/AcrR family transcriptional regulator [Caenimonas sedimenti]|uniref:TetR/AcrR family transcriptional regulator n=1 Tax=Caenimonas sedimenti TaxID=2596921 RepID=A0A562ZTU2_9BURK|nr:TetR/AcrR family transcriptional regulator [Caenimonas sedimenti]TWO71776.1 TetR/AcrR family transcriptional regulator [Caenimonas sedimenti]